MSFVGRYADDGAQPSEDPSTGKAYPSHVAAWEDGSAGRGRRCHSIPMQPFRKLRQWYRLDGRWWVDVDGAHRLKSLEEARAFGKATVSLTNKQTGKLELCTPPQSDSLRDAPSSFDGRGSAQIGHPDLYPSANCDRACNQYRYGTEKRRKRPGLIA